MNDAQLDEVIEHIKALTRLVGIQITHGMKVAEAAVLLDRAGLDRRAIADICGTTQDVIRARLSDAKRNKRPSAKREVRKSNEI